MIKKLKSNDFENQLFIEYERENILNEDTDSAIHEAYNVLRSNISFSLSGKGTKIILVTSTNPSEGKSINALNVAISYAEIGKKVILIDCDMRKPKQHRLLDLKLSPGLSNVLVGEAEIEKTIHKDKEHNIEVMCAGDIPPNSTQLLEADAMDDLLNYIRKNYDIAVFDTPPVNPVIDSCILAKRIAENEEMPGDSPEQTKRKTKPVGVVFVVKQDYTKREHLISSVKQLEKANVAIVGFILNNITYKGLTVNIGKYKSYAKYGYSAKAEKNNEKSSILNKAAAVMEKIKMKFKIRYAVFAVLAALLIAGGTVVHSHWSMIKMVYNGLSVDASQIEQQIDENETKTNEVLSKITDKQFHTLSAENRKQLANGQLTKDNAIKLIKGVPLEEQTDNNDDKNSQSGDELAEQIEFTAQDDIIAEIYLLRAEYLNEIDKLIESGKQKIKSIPQAERSFSKQLDLANEIANEGNELEKSCDARMDELLDRLETELKNNNGDTGVIKEIKELYKNEKELKKAQLVSTYYPR